MLLQCFTVTYMRLDSAQRRALLYSSTGEGLHAVAGAVMLDVALYSSSYVGCTSLPVCE
jgi:hypothetical protein